MNAKRITVLLLYISVFLLLVKPRLNIPQSMIEIGPVNIYYFEFPLLCSYILAFIIFLINRNIYGKSLYLVYGLFIAIAIIGFISAFFYATVSYVTVLKDFRPIVYWLAGINLAIVGHKYFRLKTLTWVIITGLLVEFVFGFLLSKAFKSIAKPSEFRMLVESAWLILFVVSVLLMKVTHREELKRAGKYRILPIAIAVGLLLTDIVLWKNRTTWFMLFILVVIWLIFFALFSRKAKYLMFIPIILILIWQGLQYIPMTRQAFRSLPVKIYTQRLSKERIVGAWKGVREVIYKSNVQDFKKHPVFGNGFGHEMYFDFTNYGRDKDRISTSSDNCYMTVLVKTGIAGLLLFLFAIYMIYKTMREALKNTEGSEDWIYLRAMVFAFPFFVITALNIAIFYPFPEAVIFSLFFAKSELIYSEGRR